MRIFITFVFGLCLFSGIIELFGQDTPQLNGNLQSLGSIFLRDAKIGAVNSPQYDRQLFGSESWLELLYLYKGFEVGLRLDMFFQSNLLNPNDSYSDQGIGRWYIKKSIQKLSVSGGYLYHQIGSGIIFRSYEERHLLIDNALYGLSLSWELSPVWQLQGFVGKQKNLFSTYNSLIKGASIDGFVESGIIRLAPGFGIVHKTLTDGQVDQLINTVKTYHPSDSIGLNYNGLALSVYNTWSAGPAVLYTEAAFKQNDVYYDPDSERLLYSGSSTLGKFRSAPGSVYYASISVGLKGFGVNFQWKRTRNFVFRADPFTALNEGQISYLPAMARLKSYRLNGRYTPSTREISENAIQLELRYSLSKKWKIIQYYSNITSGQGTLLYREFDNEIQFNDPLKMFLSFGIQAQKYNQEVFEGKAGVPILKSFTPYAELLYRITRKKSIRTEIQYLQTENDFGSWLFALLEYTVAPHWSFTISDMYNSGPVKTDDLHYPRVDVAYSKKANRIILSYIKQVEGVVCVGGICRLEPAFSGFKLVLFSTF